MTDLVAARLQMAVSLGFHIVFACIGMVMPFFMAASHWVWMKRGDEAALRLTKAWSKGVAILFATGAVSGTVLSFELGLLWPPFMEFAGPIFGLPFALEGSAFFLEAVAIGFYLYGWGRVSPRVHWGSAIVTGIAGLVSGIFVVSANAWMNRPAGFRLVDGKAVDIDPVAALFNGAWFPEALHMTLAAFMATGFAVAGVHAWLLLRRPAAAAIHRLAIRISLPFAAVASLLMPLSGDWNAREVARHQPAKLAAAEGLYRTQTHAPLSFGPIEIPGALSLLAFHDPAREVKGLDAFPPEDRPPVPVVRGAFQLMVGIGFALAALSLVYFWFCFRRKQESLFSRGFLRCLVAAMPLGFLAVEAGWTVTEVGRQPWIIQGVMRTREALSPMPGLMWPFLVVTGIYLVLTAVVTWLLLRQFRAVEKEPLP